MPPQQYMDAATAIYQPQQAAESAALKTTNTTTKNTLEAEKPQIQTDYQSAIDKLTQNVQDQTSKINQLYSQRLGGNFSGLQGNDMGQMFARANEQQSIISQTEANKLAQITTEEGNADITYQSNLAALTPKYQSLEAGAAASSYTADQKAAQAQANSDRTYQLSVAKFNQSAGNSAASSASSAAKAYTTRQGSNGQYFFTGPNGQPVSLAQYLEGASQGNGQVWTQTALNILKNGTDYDKSIYKVAQKAFDSHGDVAKAINNADTKNAYGLR
jgi:hypothetical protein